MITLKKISHLTGFSVSTVSKALNDKNDINVKTKKYIQDFAQKNKYIPNKNAISLRRSKSNIIAIILPRVNDSFYSETLHNMQNLAATLGYRILLFQSFEETNKEKECLDQINDGSVDGAIIFSINKQELCTKYSSVMNIPIEYIEISKKQEHDFLKATCISNFGNLLKQMK